MRCRRSSDSSMPPSRRAWSRTTPPCSPATCPLAPYRTDRPDQPSVVALPVPRPYGRWGLTKTAIEESLPDAVAAFVHWLVEKSGWRVTERDRPGEEIPVTPRHVCLLFRRFTQWGADVTRPYVEALEARGIRHMLVGGQVVSPARGGRERCARRSRPSSGPTTSWPSTRPCAGRCSRSATRPCSSIDRGRAPASLPHARAGEGEPIPST